MAKCWSVTALLALALLACVAGIEEIMMHRYIPPTTLPPTTNPYMRRYIPHTTLPPTTNPYMRRYIPHTTLPPTTNPYMRRYIPHTTLPPTTHPYMRHYIPHTTLPPTTHPYMRHYIPHTTLPTTTHPYMRHYTRPTKPPTPSTYMRHYTRPTPPYYDHVPQQKPYISKPVVSNLPPAQRCDVGISARIPCGRPHITPEDCGAINCCYDGQNCYFGKAVTLQCTKDGQFIVVVARDATLPHIDLETISLLSNGQGCTHVDSNSEFAIYNFAVSSCGTIITEEPGVIIYENRMSSSYEEEEGPRGVITRDSHYELIFQCRYIGTTVLTVVAEVIPLGDPLSISALGPTRVELRLANGQCHAKGCSEVDVAYNSFYTEFDYPVSKVLRDPVYVEVQLLEKTDPNLVLTLGRCWATTSPNPHSMPQWDILIDGCPYRDDRYLSTLVPVGDFSGLDFPTHYRRFFFKMFTFVRSKSMEPQKQQVLEDKSMDPLREQVYIHCSTAVCTATGGYSCEPSCFRKRRDVQAVDQNPSEPKVVASVGPVSMSAPEQ